MRVNYVFADGREQQCFLPKSFPLSMVDCLMDSRCYQGIVAIEILAVLP